MSAWDTWVPLLLLTCVTTIRSRGLPRVGAERSSGELELNLPAEKIDPHSWGCVMAVYPRIVPAGDAALTVEFGDAIAPRINDRVLAFARRVERSRLRGLVEVVPAYRSATVYIDPLRCNWARLTTTLAALARRPAPKARPSGNLVTIPVVYGEEFGPDLPELAKQAGLSQEAVIKLHGSTVYRVYMLGFSPGFPYLGTVPKKIVRPRLAEPRKSVPAGSVGIAGSQTGIYPQASPGGWLLIGRTPVRLYAPQEPSPFALAPGDRVRFTRISRDAFEQLSEKHSWPRST